MPSLSIKSLSQQERLTWLQLIRSENVGPKTFYNLLTRYGDAQTALEAIPELARRGGRKRPIKIFSRSLAEKELQRTEAFGAQMIAACEPDYPDLLRHVDDAPPMLILKGSVEAFKLPSVGIVGSRNCSAAGIQFTRQLAVDLARADFCVVSGLARGIDSAAHQGALAVAEQGAGGSTIGVSACGIEEIYPRENYDLYDRTATFGAVITEMPMGTKPSPTLFPRRNRIISGLSLGIVVIEGAIRSGSMITARLALEQGREVFAVPGSPLDGRHQGTNKLIRDGATLIEKADHVIEVLQSFSYRPLSEHDLFSYSDAKPQNPSDIEVDQQRNVITEKLSPTPIEVDELIRQCQVTPSVIFTILLELELAGRLERHPGNKVSLIG